MPDAPLDVIVAAFKDEKGASDALAKLKEGQKAGIIKVRDAALLTKDADSKLKIRETAEMTGTGGPFLVASRALSLARSPVRLAGPPLEALPSAVWWPSSATPASTTSASSSGERT